VPASAGHDAKILRGNCADDLMAIAMRLGQTFGDFGELSFSNSSVSTTHSTEMFVTFDGEFDNLNSIWKEELAAVVFMAGDSGVSMICKQISNSVTKVGVSFLMLVVMRFL